MKKGICLLVTLMMILASCTVLAEGVNLDGSLPIVSDASLVEPLRVVSIRQTSNVLSLEENPLAKRVLNDTGVPIEWIEVAAEGANETINLMIAGGDDIDIILAGSVLSVDAVSQYMGMDIFLPLNDYIDQYMPRLKKVLELAPEYQTAMYYPDGNIYGLPYIQELDGLVLSGGRFMINQTWLSKLNLEMPHTVEELEKVLIAFRDAGDLNNNGMDDEVPFAADFTCSAKLIGATGNPFFPFTACFADGIRTCYSNENSNAYNFFNSTADGKVEFTANSTSFKECLKWFHHLYEEGLFENNAFTTENSFIHNLGSTAESLYGVVYVWSQALNGDYVPMEPITGEGGLWNNSINNSEFQSMNGAVIMASCDQPELAAAWLDYLYDPEISFCVNWGAVGTQEDEYRFVYDENGQLKYLRNEEGERYNPEWCSLGALRWSTTFCVNGPCAVLSEYFDVVGEIDPGATLVLDGQIANGKEAMLAEAYTVPSTMRLLEEDNTVYTQYNTQIENIVMTYLMESVLDGNIDATWDGYCKSLENAGLDQVTNAIQHSFDAYNNK